MSFLEWANSRKWHRWISEGLYLITAMISFSGGEWLFGIMLIGFIAVQLQLTYYKDFWANLAERYHYLTIEQQCLLLKYVPDDKEPEAKKRITEASIEIMKALHIKIK